MFERVPAQQTRVIFYRPLTQNQPGAATVYVNGYYHASLIPGGYAELCMPPNKAELGVRMVEVGRLPKDSLDTITAIALNGGQTTFMRVREQNGVRSVLQPIALPEALPELQSTRLQIHTISRVPDAVECLDAGPAVVAKPQQINLAADALFAFSKSDKNSMTLAGRQSLDNLISKIKAGSWSFTQPTVLPDGTYTPVLNITTGGVTTPHNGTPFTIDTVPPSIVVSSDKAQLRTGDSATITFTLSEGVTDFAQGDVEVSGGALSNWTQVSPSVYTATFTPTTRSTTDSIVRVRSGLFSDTAGNTNTDGNETNNVVSMNTDTTGPDTVAPTIAISADKAALTAGQTSVITFTLSEVSANFVREDITVTGGTLSNFVQSSTDSKVYKAVFTPTTNSTTQAVISVGNSAFTDAAGNNNADAADANNTVRIDTNTVIGSATAALAPASDTGTQGDNRTGTVWGGVYTATVGVTSVGVVTVNAGTSTVTATIPSSQWTTASMANWQFGLAGRTGSNSGSVWVDDWSISQPVIVADGGAAAAETFVGTDGNETNNITAGGADKVFSGAGNDTVYFSLSSVTAGMTVDGGSGVNFLQLSSGSNATTLDLTDAAVRARVKNFSSIDMSGGLNNTLKLNSEAVLNISGTTDDALTAGANESKMLVVSGDTSGDVVNLVNLSNWTVGAIQTAATLTSTYGSNSGAYHFVTGHSYKSYTFNGATVFIDTVMTVSNATASTTASTTVYGSSVTIASLFAASFTDVDGSAVVEGQFKGVAITNAGTAAQVSGNGRYQLSTDNVTWTDIAGGLTAATAVYADKNAYIRYASTAGLDGVQPKLAVTLVDNSGLNGSATVVTGNTLNVSVNGGGTAFSSNTVTTAPVLLDLNHDAQFSYTDVVMDVNSDGHLDATRWVTAQDGVLVWDKLSDGQVHDNSQYAFSQYGVAGSTDLQGLAAGFDSNHDGVLDAKDAKFAEFKVWQDINQNGVSDAGELRSLADVGITSINLISDGLVRIPTSGVTVAGDSAATMVDGSGMLVADASFAFSTLPYTLDASATKLSVLGSDLSLDLSSFSHAHAALTEVDFSGAGANSLKLNLSDVLTLPTTNGVHRLTLTGNVDDTVNLTLIDWMNTGTVVAENGHSYAVFNAVSDSTAQLLIDQQMLLAGHVS